MPLRIQLSAAVFLAVCLAASSHTSPAHAQVKPVDPNWSWLFDNNSNPQFGGVVGTRQGAGGANNLPQFVTTTPFSYAGNTALSFDGTDDIFRIPDSAALRPGTLAWSTSLWFRAPDANSTTALVSKRSNVSPLNQWQQALGSINSSGSLVSSKRVSMLTYTGTLGWWAHTNSDVIDGDWHHMAVVRPASNSDVLIYIDGTLAGVTEVRDTGTKPHDIDNTIDWILGNNNNSGGVFFTGQMDEFAMWSGVELTQQNALWLFENSLMPVPEAEVVPEPGSIALWTVLGLAGAAMTLRSRRRT